MDFSPGLSPGGAFGTPLTPQLEAAGKQNEVRALLVDLLPPPLLPGTAAEKRNAFNACALT